MNKALKDIGFTRNRADHGMYAMGSGQSWIAIALYVDDLLTVSADKALTSKVKSQPSSVFKMKDLGLLEYFLGVKFKRTSSGYPMD